MYEPANWMSLNEAKAGPFVCFSTVQCKRFGTESVSYSETSWQESFDLPRSGLLGFEEPGPVRRKAWVTSRLEVAPRFLNRFRSTTWPQIAKHHHWPRRAETRKMLEIWRRGCVVLICPISLSQILTNTPCSSCFRVWAQFQQVQPRPHWPPSGSLRLPVPHASAAWGLDQERPQYHRVTCRVQRCPWKRWHTFCHRLCAVEPTVQLPGEQLSKLVRFNILLWVVEPHYNVVV